MMYFVTVKSIELDTYYMSDASFVSFVPSTCDWLTERNVSMKNPYIQFAHSFVSLTSSRAHRLNIAIISNFITDMIDKDSYIRSRRPELFPRHPSVITIQQHKSLRIPLEFAILLSIEKQYLFWLWDLCQEAHTGFYGAVLIEQGSCA